MSILEKLASIIGVLFAVIMNATYKSRGGIGVLIVRIFASLPLAIIILGFGAGFFFVF